MANRPKDKGTSAESMLAAHLRENGWPWAERRALNGAVDKGDITGCPGLVWECKYTSGIIKMSEWVQETVQEQANAQADHGILVVKYRGVGERNVDKWLAVMRAPEFRKLITQTWPMDPETGKSIKCSDEVLGLRYDGPAGYNSRVIPQLTTFTTMLQAELFAEFSIPILTRRPPGTTDKPESWYQITHLKNMITLLRRAGYGNPLEARNEAHVEDAG